MAFTTKKYTRPVLLNELRNLDADNFVSYSEFVSAFSPRAGARSAKLAALKNLVGNANLRTALNFKGGKRNLLNLVKNA